MRYVKKLPAADRELSKRLAREGWIKLKEPSNLPLATLLSFPFALLLPAVTACLGYFLKPELFDFLRGDSVGVYFRIDVSFVLFLIGIWLYMFIHEMLHALLIPDFIRSEKTVWGLNGAFGFVFTTEPIKKWRFLVISIMPFLLLSIGALGVFRLLGILNGYTLLLCLINASGSCVDFLNITLISFQVKKGCTIINNGFETWYNPKI